MLVTNATLFLFRFAQVVIAMSGNKQTSKAAKASTSSMADLNGSKSDQHPQKSKYSGVRNQKYQMKGHARARITSSSPTSQEYPGSAKKASASQHDVDKRLLQIQSSSPQAKQTQRSAISHSSSGLWYKDVLSPCDKNNWTTIYPPRSDGRAHRSARSLYEMKERALVDGKDALVTNKKRNGKLVTTPLKGYTWEVWANHHRYRIPGLNFPIEKESSASKNNS